MYGFTRRFGQPLPPLSGLPARWIVTGFGVAITLASAWLSIGAVRALGKQWSLQARVLSDHELITTGPFAIVRHPIYTSLLGLCIVMGLALSTLPVLAVAIAFCFAGTAVRIRSEEALLREKFGARYTDYANYVPALIPRPRQP
ncbi:MAG: isoprenylcysteine carboxylmethyltransferase family protein [Gemmatimonadota bacterium]